MRLLPRTLLRRSLTTAVVLLAAPAGLVAQSLSGYFSSDFVSGYGVISDNTAPSFTLSRSVTQNPVPFVTPYTTVLTTAGTFGMGSLTLDIDMSSVASTATPSGGGDVYFGYNAADTLSFDHTSNLDIVLRLTPSLNFGTSSAELLNNWAQVSTTIRFDTSTLDDPTYTWYYVSSTQTGGFNNISTADIALTLEPGATLSFTTGVTGQLWLSLASAGVTSLDGWIDGTLGWEIVSLSDPTVNVSSLSGWNYVATSAVPEPSTYALGAGALALGIAAWTRRRRAAASATEAASATSATPATGPR